MKLTEKTFSIYYSILGLIILGLTYLANNYLPIELKYEKYPYLFLYFFASTSLIIQVLLKKSKSDPKKFIQAFLILTTVKLLANSMIALIFAFTNSADAKAFLILFLAYYLIFTIIEVIAVSKKWK